MNTNYDAALKRLLAHEGGYSNHPADPGGPTNFGITLADFRKYIKSKATSIDVKNMTVDQAKQIYRPKYWDAMRCGELPPGVDYAVFDYGVNSGTGRCGTVLRRCLSLPSNTSMFTDEVVLQARAAVDDELVVKICTERLAFLKSLKTWPVFGAGWGRRVADVWSASLVLAKQTPLVESPNIVPAPGAGVDPAEHAQIASLQRALAAAGFDPGAIDGDLGPKTIKAFQKSRGLDPDGVVGKKTRPLLAIALREHALVA